MPKPVSQLGGFTFRFWLGEPLLALRQSVQVFSHPGVDYEGVRWMGIRSQEQVRRSVVDVADQTAGKALYNQYAAAIETGPHQIIWNDYDYDDENTRAVIRDVEIDRLRRHVLICGGIDDNNKWDLVVRWTLLLTPFP